MAMKNFAALFLKRVQISEIPHTCISNVYQIFIFHPILMHFFVHVTHADEHLAKKKSIKIG
jgi:hypothetical protein